MDDFIEDIVSNDLTDFTDPNINRLSLSDDDGSLSSLEKGDLGDSLAFRRISITRIPSMEGPCSTTVVDFQLEKIAMPNEVLSGIKGSGQSVRHDIAQMENMIFPAKEQERPRTVRQSLGNFLDFQDHDDEEEVLTEEQEVIAEIQESSSDNFLQDNEATIALLNNCDDSDDHDEPVDVVVVEVNCPSFSGGNAINSGAVDLNIQTTPVTTKTSRRGQSCSKSTRDFQSCCMSYVINPITNCKMRDEPINALNREIPRDVWAAAFNEDEISGCARHIFKNVFTPEEIKKCTYSGKNNTQQLCRERTEFIFTIVAWMRNNKKEYPYPFNPCLESFRVEDGCQLSEGERAAIIKKVFVEDRSQLRMKHDNIQKQKRSDEPDVPPKAKRARKS